MLNFTEIIVITINYNNLLKINYCDEGRLSIERGVFPHLTWTFSRLQKIISYEIRVNIVVKDVLD